MAAMAAAEGLLIIACGALAHEITALRRANALGSSSMCAACRPSCTIGRKDSRCRARAHTCVSRTIPIDLCRVRRLRHRRAAGQGAARGRCGAHPRRALLRILRHRSAVRRTRRGGAGHVLSDGFSAASFRAPGAEGLGLDRHPELLSTYFGNYRKLVYLAQAPHPQAREQARAIAARMGLEFEYRDTGYGALETALVTAVRLSDVPRSREAAWRR